MREFLRNNGLSLALFVLFLASILGQLFVAGARSGKSWRSMAISRLTFALSLQRPLPVAMFENWESEFLQMGVYVLLTAWLIQKGSPESRAPDESSDEPCASGPGSLGQPARVGCGFACTLTR